jgi:hypothetical protein
MAGLGNARPRDYSMTSYPEGRNPPFGLFRFRAQIQKMGWGNLFVGRDQRGGSMRRPRNIVWLLLGGITLGLSYLFAAAFTVVFVAVPFAFADRR